jgi:hypothetical protein
MFHDTEIVVVDLAFVVDLGGRIQLVVATVS